MRVPSALELLDAWERGLGRPPAQQALTLLTAGWPEADVEALVGLAIGRRDARLLALRAASFGPRVVGLAGCPACPEQLELDFDLADVQVTAVDPDRPVEPLEVTVPGYEVRFRLPTTGDLLASTAAGDLAGTRRALLDRCVAASIRGEDTVAPDTLPEQVVAAVEAGMAAADPQADIRLAVACPSCGHMGEVSFDIAAFLWWEIEAWAVRTLSDVHVLACAYGWPEAEILALSPARRQFYLTAVGG